MDNPQPPEQAPRAPGWPLVGNLPALARGGMDYVQAQEAELGSIYRIDAGTQPVVLLCHPDHALHVLRTNAANYRKQGTFWSSVRSLLGLGLPTIEGDVWRSRRKMMNPQFRKDRIEQMGKDMAEVILETIDTWPTEPTVEKVAYRVNQLTMAVIVRTMFGTGLSREQTVTVSEAMSFSLDHMLQKVVTDALPSWVPVPGRSAHRDAVKRIDEVLYDILERRREQGPGDDLLSMFLMMRDEDSGRGLDDTELRDETMSIFVAGYETTATAVSWAVGRMASDPAFAALVQEEVDEVLQGRPPGPDDVEALPFLNRVFLETLRLQGPVYFLPRLAVEDDVIGGHHVPAGTMVSLLLDRIHRHPDCWEDPDSFDPDRFLPERSVGRHPCAFIPFGAGQRQCIGKGFAMMEGVLLLAAIAQRFRFEELGDEPIQEQFAITRRPRDGMRLRVLPR